MEYTHTCRKNTYTHKIKKSYKNTDLVFSGEKSDKHNLSLVIKATAIIKSNYGTSLSTVLLLISHNLVLA